MMTPGSANALLLADAGYQVQRSVRLRSSASGYFSRTPASAGNRKTWTWAGWVKRGVFGQVHLFDASTNSTVETAIRFRSTNTIQVFYINSTYVFNVSTNALHRDPSAWYHIVVAFDTTQATESNRLKIYVNGEQATSLADTVYPALNTDYPINNNIAHNLGRSAGVGLHYLDGYLTDINFIDGQALTPASFGEINPVTGVWSAKKYAGTYGTNGFFLNFSDNSAATAAAIGKDSSGNGNNWTPSGVSVTTGVTYDSMLDVPLGAGGAERGNYCVMNPLVISGLSGGSTLSNGNLRVSGTQGVSNAYARGTMALSGKLYAEFFFDVVNATASIGVDSVTATSGALNATNTNVCYRSGGNKRVLGTETSYGASWVANDIIGVAVDTSASTVEFFKNGVSQGAITSTALFAQGDCVFAIAKDDIGSPLGFANFGQRPFAYTPPTGFKALHTGNLPEPVIKQGASYMAATTYTGNGGTQSIVNTVNGVSFQPDFLWTKSRSNGGGGYNNVLFDAVRGTSKSFSSDLTASEYTGTDLTSFNSNGFTAAAPNQWYGVNANGATFVAWQWKANGAAVSNTAGSITSQVSAGVSQGFSVVTYTGTGANATVGHGLGVVPRMVIVKRRDAVAQWNVYHASIGATGRLYLNATDAINTSTAPWNDTAPTSTVFTIGTASDTNASGSAIVAYCFSEVAGYSKFGSYTGNGSADGPFVFCGFRPRFVMVKRTDTTGNWEMHDTSRATYNADAPRLWANLSSAEDATEARIDELSNGFKLRSGAGDINVNGGTYIFAAFAEAPFKNSLAR